MRDYYTRILTATYAINGLLHITAGLAGSDTLAFVTKFFIIPLLLLICYVNLSKTASGLKWFLITGLLFSWCGDILLEFSGGMMFIMGLAAFLLAQLSYLSLFLKTKGGNALASRRWYFLVPVVISGIILAGVLYNHLGNMRLPVLMYTLVIMSMLAAAINRIEKVPKASYIPVLAGSILFVMSDSAIAVNKFLIAFNWSSVVVMTTYISAQYLITTGVIKQFSRGVNETG
ncbi:MAG: lysoplasmalogenase [Bacteroidales bacterium]|jgi:uncharacterized membrane protein YhhN|nr:lysoplasmalogenase [Bacteroidales bacterium]MCU0407973.1 lysoplasmalogenase [Bacteroidales bacterium]